jgi:amino acid adenylation domain-containing protein
MSRELSEGAKALSQREGVTLFMALIAAFKVMLYRYTGERDVAVGTPIAGRNRREVEGLIGVFINTLVLRTDLSGEPTFKELMGREREVALGAYANQDVPFERLVEELQPERDLSRGPLFQVMFVLQNAPMPALKMADVFISHQDIEAATSKFDMTFAVMEKEDGILSGWLEHNTTLFDESMIEQMISHYRNILQSVIADPLLPISRIQMLSPAERNQALAASAHPVPFHRQGISLHQLFEAQARATPLATALVFQDSSISYQELNSRANKLAHLLRSRGIRPDSLVAVALDRSPDLVVAILATLKAGGAYLPLDPTYPQDRVAFVLDDARVTVLLTQRHLLDSLPHSDAETICLDSDWDSIDRFDADDPVNITADNNLAYVIYTSGSTGKPKGVLVTHANVVRLLDATHHWFDFDQRDVWTLFHSFAFDFSVWELWGALCYGGRLVIVPYLVSRSPQAFYDLLVDQQVTVLNQTPSAFRQLMQVDESSPLSRELSLRAVIFGGEALDLQSLRPWFDRHGDERPRLVNMYGITETTVHVTYRPLTTADSAEGNGSLIGEPIPDLRVYVLDRQMEPVALSVAGEMYVGGEGVARGYLYRPELTAERFIPDPYGQQAGARLYRTGDVARRVRGGELEYLGRIDEQVKIRGFRIELGEVEAALYEQEGVKEAVVLAREAGGGDKQLVAYVVVDEGAGASVNEMREGLKRKLPEYMVPGAFVMMERLPLTENGKVDRRALPAPDRNRDGLEQEYIAPRTEDEESLAGIFSEILRVDKVGVHDNFFELGGHSLLATQVLTRILERFKVEVPLRRLFETPSVAGLAEAISETVREEVEEINPIAKVSQPVEELLLDNLDQLTDQQIEALLINFTTQERRK